MWAETMAIRISALLKNVNFPLLEQKMQIIFSYVQKKSLISTIFINIGNETDLV